MDQREIGRLEHGALWIGLAAHGGAAPRVDASTIAGNIVGKRGIEEKRGEAGEPEMQLVELVVESGVGFFLFGEFGDSRQRKRGGIRQRKMIGGHCIELLAKLGDYGFLRIRIHLKRQGNYAVLLSVDGEIELGFKSGDGLKSAFHSLDFLVRIFAFLLFLRDK